MKITINVYRGGGGKEDTLINLDVFSEMTLGALRDSVQAETGIPLASITVYHDGVPLTDDNKTVEQLGFAEGEMLLVYVRNSDPSRRQQQAASSAPSSSSPVPRAQPQQRSHQPLPRSKDSEWESMRQRILSDPRSRAQLRYMDAQIEAAVDDPVQFSKLMAEREDGVEMERDKKRRLVEALNADPFDIEAQAQIEEMIRQERVTENLQNAMEHNPEVFGRVHMLYMEVEVNGYKVKALVDSGAQETIMSPSIAEKCGIMRLVDTRFAGVAMGVGTAKILGKVHSAHIKIGNLHLPCSFTVMEGKSVEMLLGLDMLKRYQACIDLGKDKLIIQGEEMPFLGAADIPKGLDEAVMEEPRIPAPSRTAHHPPTGAGPSGTQSTVAGPSGAQPSTAGPSGSALSTVQTAPPAPTPQVTARDPNEEKIQQLVAMGCSRETAVNGLQAAEGNVELAASFIFMGP
jgi:DNA damage-inducible protein 1